MEGNSHEMNSEKNIHSHDSVPDDDRGQIGDAEVLKEPNKCDAITSQSAEVNLTGIPVVRDKTVTESDDSIKCGNQTERIKAKFVYDQRDKTFIDNNSEHDSSLSDKRSDSNVKEPANYENVKKYNDEEKPSNSTVDHNEEMITDNSCTESNIDTSCNVKEKPSDSCVDNRQEMIIENPSESDKVINEANMNDLVENSNNSEENRDSVVVDAMNKNLSWKDDNIYQKDLSSLRLLCEYGSGSDEENNEEEKMETENSASKSSFSLPAVNSCPPVSQEYRKPIVTASSESDETDSSEEDDETSSSSATSSDETETSDNECVIVGEKKSDSKVPKTKGELGVNDLPPIEDLHISVPEAECVQIGNVLNIVDTLVVVQSLKDYPALDLDSVLFLDSGKETLGHVFDVFGKVGEACYCVRFNSKEHALERGVEVGMPVYYAPNTEHSIFVFLADLMKMKGSDASWENNNEPPRRFLEYSDDEEERRARKGNKPPTRDVEPEETQPQAKKFNKRGLYNRRGTGCGSPATDSPYPNHSWSNPFSKFTHAPPNPPPRMGQQPLIRPSSFRSPRPPQSHFHNAGAGAPAVPQMPSPWAVPPPSMSQNFHFNNNPSLQSHPQFPQNHVRPPSFNINASTFGQPPLQPPGLPPSSVSSRNYMMPTSIPGAGAFVMDYRNPQMSDSGNLFSLNQMPPHQNMPPQQNNYSDSGNQSSFGWHDKTSTNNSVPPSSQPHQGW